MYVFATQQIPMKNCGGLILCGGKSSRMGTSKAWLKFGDETSLARVVRILQPLVSPIVVVAAQDQELPPLPPDIRILRDEFDSQGPLAGLAVGLQALQPHVPPAYCTSCDVPLLKPAFVQFLFSRLDDHAAVVVRAETYWHPLTAVYRTSLADRARSLVEQNQLRVVGLFEQQDVLPIPEAEVRAVDPELLSLRNLNTPEDYATALEIFSRLHPST